MPYVSHFYSITQRSTCHCSNAILPLAVRHPKITLTCTCHFSPINANLYEQLFPKQHKQHQVIFLKLTQIIVSPSSQNNANLQTSFHKTMQTNNHHFHRNIANHQVSYFLKSHIPLHVTFYTSMQTIASFFSPNNSNLCTSLMSLIR